MKSEIKAERVGFYVFTAVFAALAAFVFWGTWSSDVAPVMPDDSVWHPISYSDQLLRAWREWLSNGSFVPVLPFWNGVLPQYGMQELKYAVSLYCAGLGLAYFLRGRGLSRLASYGAGLFLGFCGYWATLFSAGHGTWFLLMASFVPAFGFLDRAIVGGKVRHWILTGAAVGWGSCYQPDIFMLLSVLLVAYGVYACVRERRFPWKGGLIAIAFFAIVGGPGIHNAFTGSLVARDQQIENDSGTALTGGKGKNLKGLSDAEKAKEKDEARWIFVTNWSMPPEDTLEFFIPRIHGDTSCPMTLQLGRAAGKDVRPYTGRLGRPINAPSGNYRQHSLYVGWMTCILALFGAAWGLASLRGAANREPAPADGRPRTADAVFFAVAAIVFWLFSMGRFCEPVYRIVYHLPFGDYLRAPVKWHHVTEFCLCALAGMGLEALFGFLKAREMKVRTAFAIVAAVILVGAIDLAKNDKIFCAPLDLRIITGKNAAADDVLRCGKGTICDLVEGGQGLLAWSFQARGLGMNRDINAKGTRFVLAGNEQVRRTPQLAAWFKAKATPVGYYAITQTGIHAAPPSASNVSLYQVKDVPPPVKSKKPPVSMTILALGIVSLAGTAAAVVSCLSLSRQSNVLSQCTALAHQ